MQMVFSFMNVVFVLVYYLIAKTKSSNKMYVAFVVACIIARDTDKTLAWKLCTIKTREREE